MVNLESPRWLLKKQRYHDSFKSFCCLRNSEVMAARDLVGPSSFPILLLGLVLLTTAFPGVVLRVSPNPGRKGSLWRHNFPTPSHRTLHDSTASSCDLWRRNCHDGAAILRHQHHGLLLFLHLCRSWLYDLAVSTRVVWVWSCQRKPPLH